MARTVGSAAEDTRARILETAADLFVTRGYAGTSVRDISERLGMTKGSLYYHFSAKQELLVALLAPLFAAIDEFVAAARQCGQVTRPLVARLVEVLDAHGPMLRACIADPSVERAQLEPRHKMLARFVELQQILGGGRDAGAILRARCVLGVIQAGVLAPREGRMSELEKAFVVDAAMAVLAVGA